MNLSRVRLIGSAALLFLAGCTARTTPVQSPSETRPAIAFTFDDLPAHATLPQGETRVDIARRIIAALKADDVPAYGFVNGIQTEREPASTLVLPEWVAAGLPLGNHTWSHANLKDLTVEQFEDEIARNEPLLARFDPNGDWHWFRYPFLWEGWSHNKRGGIRTYLAQHGYHIAEVTMSFDDWAYNDVYARCVAKGDSKAIATMEKDWLDHARDSALAARTMSKAVHGRDIPYVLLMHLGAFDARLLPRLIALYKHMGFRFVTLPEAESDPAYATNLDPSLPAGPQGLDGAMRAKGLTVPAGHTAEVDLATICT